MYILIPNRSLRCSVDFLFGAADDSLSRLKVVEQQTLPNGMILKICRYVYFTLAVLKENK